MSTQSSLLIGRASVAGKCRAERLAAELLAMIFHEVIALHVVLPTSPEENEVNTKPLHILSHVCRYWRDVALGNPALWRRIHGRCHDQMEVFLERSRPLTATLFLDVEHWSATPTGPPPTQMMSVVKAHGGRLHRLDLIIVPAQEYVARLLTSLQAPHLESLTITSLCTNHPSSADTMTRDRLLNAEASLLKALAIMPIFDWIPSCTSFPSLMHLFISFDPQPGLYHPFDVLQLLSNVPVLAFLRVDSLLYDASYSGDWHPPSDAVPLLRLRSVVFTSCSYKLMRAILSRLLLSEDVFIRLQDVSNLADSDGYPAPLPPLALHPVTSLNLSTGDEQILMVADGPTSGLWFEGYHDAMEEAAPIGWETWLLRLHERLALSHVTYLHVDIGSEPIFWSEFLAQLPRVSHLAVLLGEYESSDPPNFFVLSPLAILCRALSPRPPAPIRCPVLRTLTIEWQQDITLETASNFPQIPAILTARAHAGHPIHHVVMQATSHSPSSDTGAVTALDIFQDFAHSVSPDDTEYEIIKREDGAKGLYAFEMRDVWKIEGEDKYWDVDDDEKLRYVLPRR